MALSSEDESQHYDGDEQEAYIGEEDMVLEDLDDEDYDVGL